MSDAVNMLEIVTQLPKRRWRACIVLTHDYLGQRAWAAELASQTEADHIDLLERAASDEKLGNAISTISATDLLPWLQKQSQTKVIIVSGIEFLIATWGGNASAIDQLASSVEMWAKSPAILLVTQHNTKLANCERTRSSRDLAFVIDQKDTLALT